MDNQEAQLVPASNGTGRRFRRRFFVLMSFVLVGVDQLTKWLVVAYVQPGHPLRVLPFLDFTYSTNTGVAFGMWARGGRLLALAAGACIVGLLIWGAKYAGRNALLGWAIACLVGGALGNVVDRLRLGHVVDFIDFRFWPVFNFADACVVVGAILLLIHGLLSGQPAPESCTCAPAEESER